MLAIPPINFPGKKDAVEIYPKKITNIMGMVFQPYTGQTAKINLLNILRNITKKIV
jgi:hypothetical protein